MHILYIFQLSYLLLELDEPLSFTKMAFDERGVFELSWKNASSLKMSNGNQLNDYTIFWCESDKDRPYQCNVCIILYLVNVVPYLNKNRNFVHYDVVCRVT